MKVYQNIYVVKTTNNMGIYVGHSHGEIWMKSVVKSTKKLGIYVLKSTKNRGSLEILRPT